MCFFLSAKWVSLRSNKDLEKDINIGLEEEKWWNVN